MGEERFVIEASAWEVLQLGDPALRIPARVVEDPGDPGFRADLDRLHAVLESFRETHGFGRAIAAPQIGIGLRLVAAHLGEGPFELINPVIVSHSHETFTLWDDCMSFPDLLVRVRRHCSIDLRFLDREGRIHTWRDLDRATSELFQHELDHLEGVLAVDRALDRDSLVTRRAFEAHRNHFQAQVDPPLPMGR